MLEGRFTAVYEEVLVDILRQLRMLPEHTGDIRVYVFESAARTVRRRFPEILKESADDRYSGHRSTQELAEVGDLEPGELRNAMKGLAPAERELLALRFRFGFSYGQISDIIKLARVQIEDKLIEARHGFRARLLDAHGGEPRKPGVIA